MKLYIVTPTYNRGPMLKNLYDSLINQSDLSFTWLIIDDGSKDNTKALVDSFVQENIIQIEYRFKENGGKHSAYNHALEIMNGEGYHLCVDSDDILDTKAIEIFQRDIKTLNFEQYIGLVYPKMTLDRRYEWLDPRVKGIHIPDLQYKYRLKCESCILMNNQELMGFRFPIIDGERYMTEGLMYIYLADKGEFKVLDEAVYYYEYQEDGLTKNIFSLWTYNPKGTIMTLKAAEKYALQFLKGRDRIEALLRINLNIQGLKLKTTSLWKVIQEEKLKAILLPFSFIFKRIRFK